MQYCKNLEVLLKLFFSQIITIENKSIAIDGNHIKKMNLCWVLIKILKSSITIILASIFSKNRFFSSNIEKCHGFLHN